MKRMLMLAAGIAFALGVVAMPTNSEIMDADRTIEQLIKDDVAAVQSGSKTRRQLAETLLGYLDGAESEAAKFSLVRRAFQQYMDDGSVKKALDTYDILGGYVAGVPDGTFGTWCAPYVTAFAKEGRTGDLATMLDGAISIGDSASAASLYKQIRNLQKKLSLKIGGSRLANVMERFAGKARRQKELKALRAHIEKSPNDAELREKHGMYLAAIGNWEDAIREFSRATGRLAEVAAWEMKPDSPSLTSASVAEFWWEKSESVEGSDVKAALRSHAATWYQRAISEGALPGLKKVLAEKRIAEAEKSGRAVSMQSASGGGKPIRFMMSKNAEMELLPCPAGTFEMGYRTPDRPEFAVHKVTISRPFWMAKFLVTREQWNAEMTPRQMSESEKALGGIKAAIGDVPLCAVDEFCRILTKKYGRFLPEGYIFRLPTEAEWEYACRAGADSDDPYGMPIVRRRKDAEAIAVTHYMKRAILEQAGIAPPKYPWQLPGYLVGQKKPNRWGLYDMIGSMAEMTYDRLSSTLPGQSKGGDTPKGMVYEDSVDPLMWTDDRTPIGIVRCTAHVNSEGPDIVGWAIKKRPAQWGENRIPYRGIPSFGFRIVAGPNLVGEHACMVVNGGGGMGEEKPDGTMNDSPADEAPGKGKWKDAVITTSTILNNVKVHTVKLDDSVNMEFSECPAGSFIMGFEEGAHSPSRRHKVTFTRPFWIARTKLTVEQYKTWDKEFVMPKEFAAIANDEKIPLSVRFFRSAIDFHKSDDFNDNVRGFLKELNERFRDKIPKGYRFRLPTEAEWEYAYTANEKSSTDFYGASGDLTETWKKSRLRKYMFDKATLADRVKRLGMAKSSYYGTSGIGVAVGQLKPNRWGLYDMAGNLDERLGDILNVDDLDKNKGWLNNPDQVALVYEDEEIDPIKRETLRNEKMMNIARGGDMGKWGKRTGGFCVRFVVGPNLMEENWHRIKEADAKRRPHLH